MKAVILSAGPGFGRGRAAELPKGLLPVREQDCVLQLQLEALAACGVREATVVTDSGAERVEAFLDRDPVPGIRARGLFNPFHDVSGSLASCWLARNEMQREFLLVEGETLFSPQLLATLLAAPRAPLTLAIDVKDEYEARDVVVSRVADRLRAIGSDLEPPRGDGSSIGLMLFRDVGPEYFRHALACAMREARGIDESYLLAVARMAEETAVRTCSVEGAWQSAIDTPEGLFGARGALRVGQRGLVPARPLAPAAALS